jgi:DNA-binding FadR family transcriptional regulator
MDVIVKKSLADEVADRVLAAIAGGKYPIGTQLPIEPELMKLFGVGRSTIREAIKTLAIQGVLDVQQGVGTFVINNQVQESLNKKLSRAETADIMEVRSLLEVKIAEKAALNRTALQLKTMKKLLEERKKFAGANNVKQCIETDIRFHIELAEACGNPVLTEIYKAASIEVIRALESHNTDTKSFKTSQAIHEKLYEWVKQQEPAKAAAAVRSIIGRI